MKYINTKGIILRETPVSEWDKSVIVLLKDYGKKMIYIKGARRIKSKFNASTKVFMYCDFILYQRNHLLSLSQADVIKNFYGISTSYDHYCYGQFITELTEKTILEGEESDRLLYLLLKAYQALEKQIIDPRLILYTYIFKFLQLNGYGIESFQCTYCGNENIAYLSHEGFLCHGCSHQTVQKVSVVETVVYTISYIMQSKVDHLFSFQLDEVYLENLKKSALFYLKIHSDIRLKSMDLINI